MFSPAKKADEGAEAERSPPAYGHGRKYAIVDFCLEGKPLIMRLARICILLYPSLPYSSPRRSFLRLYSVLYTYTWLPGDISTSTPGVLALPRWLSLVCSTNRVLDLAPHHRPSHSLSTCAHTLFRNRLVAPQISPSNLLSYPFIYKSTSDRLSTPNSQRPCRPPPPSPPWTIL